MSFRKYFLSNTHKFLMEQWGDSRNKMLKIVVFISVSMHVCNTIQEIRSLIPREAFPRNAQTNARKSRMYYVHYMRRPGNEGTRWFM